MTNQVCPKCGETYSPMPVHACLGSRSSNELLTFLRHDTCAAHDACEPCKGLRQQSIEMIERLQRRVLDLEGHDAACQKTFADRGCDCGQLDNEPLTTPHSDSHLERFSEWLVKEMPAGTVIGDPHWWARKLLGAACVFADEAPAQPPSEALSALRDARHYVVAFEPCNVSEAHDRDLMLASIDGITGLTKCSSTET